MTITAAAEAPETARLLTADETARWLRISRRTLDRLVARGEIRPVHVGSLPRFLVKDVLAFLETT